MNKKVKRNINTYVGEHEIVLPDHLVKVIYEEIEKQIDDDFEEIDMEIIIEVSDEEIVEARTIWL